MFSDSVRGCKYFDVYFLERHLCFAAAMRVWTFDVTLLWKIVVTDFLFTKLEIMFRKAW